MDKLSVKLLNEGLQPGFVVFSKPVVESSDYKVGFFQKLNPSMYLRVP